MEVVDVTSASLVAQTTRRGEWNDMFLESAVCDEKTAVSRRRSEQHERRCWCSWANSPRLGKHWRERCWLLVIGTRYTS